MILNDSYSIALLSLLALSMIAFTVLFAIYIYTELGGVKFGRDSFLFFDYILFCSGWKPNASALSVLCVFIFGLAFGYKQNTHSEGFLIDVIWLVGIVLFFIHCRFLSNVEYENKKGVAFAKELFINLRLQPKFMVLWMARIVFIILIICRFYP